MCNVAKFVSNPNIRRVLTETDGLGTEATRASIIEILLERGFVVRTKKAIVSTATGRALIKSLPDVATTPDMTAVWEAAMRAITEGHQTLDAFLARVNAQLQQLIDQGRALGQISVPATPSSHSDGARYNGPSTGNGKKKSGSKQAVRPTS
jgi:DNA topoisomerase-3